MTEHIRSNRPARAAIAAVLALTATPLLAQTAATTTPPSVAPMVAPEIAVPSAAPSAPAPTQPAQGGVEFTPSQPVVQATAPIEERIAAATAAAEAEKATSAEPRRTETRRAAPVRTAEAAPASRATAAAPAAATPAPAAPAVASDPAPVTSQTQAAPATAVETAPAPAPAPAPVTEAAARTDEALLWALGGGALLLLGLGGTALVRRRRVNERDDVVYAPDVAPVPVAPVPVAAQAMPVAPRPAFTPVSQRVGEDATLEAMVAASPSAENPFRTRTKRLRRAQYLLAQRETAPIATAPQTIHAEPALTPAVDRSQTVYRFGNQPVRPGFLKPRTR